MSPHTGLSIIAQHDLSSKVNIELDALDAGIETRRPVDIPIDPPPVLSFLFGHFSIPALSFDMLTQHRPLRLQSSAMHTYRQPSGSATSGKNLTMAS